MKIKNETKSAIKSAKSMQRDLLGNAQDIGNVLTTAENVQPAFMPHAFNMVTGLHGVANLIADILTEREAMFARGIESTELRKVAIAASMFASEVIAEVQARFAAGTSRYPYETIHMYLSVFMNHENKHALKGLPSVAKIKLTNAEDKPRPCYKPRTKYYLVQD